MNKELGFRIDLSQVKIPELKEIKAYRGNYYKVGDDDKFYNELIYYYENSSTHNSFINNFTQKVVGSGFKSETQQELIDELKINEKFFKATLDYAIFGGFAFEIIWNALHTKITKINYLDFSKIRSGFIDEETDEVELYYFSPDWSSYRKKVSILQKFSPDDKTDNAQIYYYRGHHPGTDIYPRPHYLGGLKWIYTDVELSKYYANLVKNNFVSNTIISVSAGNIDAEKQLEFEKGIKENFTSSENAGSIVVLYGDGENSVELLEFGKGADDQRYSWLSQHTIDQLVVAHRIPNPIIAGIRIPGTLGGSQEMMDAENIYNKNVIYPSRKIITGVITELNKYLITPITDWYIEDVGLFTNIEKNT